MSRQISRPLPAYPSLQGLSVKILRRIDFAVEGTGDYHEGKDGLVAYPSAHVDYAESEYIVRSFHSCQDRPATIEEVRHILHKHLDELPESVRPVEPEKGSDRESRPATTNAPSATEPK